MISNDFKFVNVSNTNTYTPDLSGELLGRGYVPYDFDNLLPQRLTDLYINSPIHSSIVNKKVDMIMQDGIEFDNAKIADNIDNGNGIELFIRKIATDLILFGGFAIEMIPLEYYNFLGDMVHINFQTLRAGMDTKKNENNNYDTGYWYSSDWTKATYKHKPIFISKFNYEYQKNNTVFYYKMYNPVSTYYPLPSYFSAYNSILTEIELINFTKNLILNSFTPNGVLQLPIEMSKTTTNSIKKEFADEFVGSGNAGKLLIVNGDKDNPVNFIPFSNNPGERDVTPLLNTIRQDIIMAHEVSSPTILGLPSGSTLSGDGSTIVEGKKLFMESVILPIRKIIETEVNSLLPFLNTTAQFKFKNPKNLQENESDSK
jgi:hypothetical protein